MTRSTPNPLDNERLALVDAMHAIVPHGIRHDIRRISGAWIEDLLPEERAIAADFTDARRTEFATGRTSVRRLLRELDSADPPILIGARRAPIVPPGLHASISHCETFVATIASKANHIMGLGVDIEFHDRVTPDLADAVLSRTEKADLKRDQGTRSLACYFSAKEAAFKAVHGLIGKYIDFSDIELTICCDRFVAQPLFVDRALEDIRVEGRVTERERYVLAVAWASPSSASAQI